MNPFAWLLANGFNLCKFSFLKRLRLSNHGILRIRSESQTQLLHRLREFLLEDFLFLLKNCAVGFDSLRLDFLSAEEVKRPGSTVRFEHRLFIGRADQQKLKGILAADQAAGENAPGVVNGVVCDGAAESGACINACAFADNRGDALRGFADAAAAGSAERNDLLAGSLSMVCRNRQLPHLPFQRYFLYIAFLMHREASVKPL